MSVKPTDLFTTRRPETLPGKILQFPLVRVLAAILFIAPAIALHNLLMIFVIEKFPTPWYEAASSLMFPVDLTLILLLYRLYTRVVEGRPAHELSLRGAIPEFARGFSISAALVAVTVLVMLAAGSFRVEGISSPWVLLHALCLFSAGAFIQVMIFRLILFRLTEELLGTWIAFVLIGGLFGLAHAANENFSMAGFAGLIFSDVLLFAVFALTRRLWLVWGVHAGWNLCQDGIFGMPNSGLTQFPSWLQSSTSGPEWLTGGAFGIEASLLTNTLTFIVGICIVVLAVRRGQTIAPSWRRRKVS